MRVHKFCFMVIVAAILAEVKILSCTIDDWSPIFTVAARIIPNFKFLILRNSKICLVLHLILPVLFDKKVVLESILIFRLNYQRVAVLHFWSLGCSCSTKANFAKKESEYFIRLVGVTMDVNMPCIKNQIFQSDLFINHLSEIIFAEIS